MVIYAVLESFCFIIFFHIAPAWTPFRQTAARGRLSLLFSRTWVSCFNLMHLCRVYLTTRGYLAPQGGSSLSLWKHWCTDMEFLTMKWRWKRASLLCTILTFSAFFKTSLILLRISQVSMSFSELPGMLCDFVWIKLQW